MFQTATVPGIASARKYRGLYINDAVFDPLTCSRQSRVARWITFKSGTMTLFRLRIAMKGSLGYSSTYRCRAKFRTIK